MLSHAMLLLRLLATLWFAIAVGISSFGICSINLLGRFFLLIHWVLRGRDAYEAATCRWATATMSGGAVAICLFMSPIWRIKVIDNVSIDPPLQSPPSTSKRKAHEESKAVTSASECSTPEKNSSSLQQRPVSSNDVLPSLLNKNDVLSSSDVERPSTDNGEMMSSGFSSVVFRGFAPSQLLTDKNTQTPPSLNESIIMANHLGNADGFILRACTFGWLSGCKMIYKASLNKIPLFGWAFQLTGDFPVHFQSSNLHDFGVRKGTVGPMIAQVREHLNNKMPVALFPEGVRSVDGKLQPFRNGFFRLSVEENIDIFPIALVGSRAAWTPGSSLVNFATLHILRSQRAVSPKGKDVETLKADVANAITNMTSNFFRIHGGVGESR